VLYAEAGVDRVKATTVAIAVQQGWPADAATFNEWLQARRANDRVLVGVAGQQAELDPARGRGPAACPLSKASTKNQPEHGSTLEGPWNVSGAAG
jgi:hypothetical protein